MKSGTEKKIKNEIVHFSMSLRQGCGFLGSFCKVGWHQAEDRAGHPKA